MSASLILACGCQVRFSDGKVPSCPAHGPQRVVRTVGMRKPTFRGHVTGPVAKTEDLGPWTGKIVETE